MSDVALCSFQGKPALEIWTVQDVGRLWEHLHNGNDRFNFVMGYRTAAERLDAESESDRARKRKAEADTAELAVMRERGEVMMRDSALAWMADERTEVRRTIERADYMTPTQKNKLLTALSKMKPKLLE